MRVRVRVRVRVRERRRVSVHMVCAYCVRVVWCGVHSWTLVHACGLYLSNRQAVDRGPWTVDAGLRSKGWPVPQPQTSPVDIDASFS